MKSCDPLPSIHQHLTLPSFSLTLSWPTSFACWLDMFLTWMIAIQNYPTGPHIPSASLQPISSISKFCWLIHSNPTLMEEHIIPHVSQEYSSISTSTSTHHLPQFSPSCHILAASLLGCLSLPVFPITTHFSLLGGLLLFISPCLTLAPLLPPSWHQWCSSTWTPFLTTISCIGWLSWGLSVGWLQNQ